MVGCGRIKDPAREANDHGKLLLALVLPTILPASAIAGVEFGEFSTMVISDTAVAFAGMDTFSSTRDGKTTERPARFTFLVTKCDQGWSIKHFHSSWLPGQ